jgi:hypothetical protein
MSAQDKLAEYAAAWIADCGESYDTADAHAARLVQEHRAEVLNEAAAEIERVAVADDGPALQWNWWDAATIPASIAALLRDMAGTNTTQES